MKDYINKKDILLFSKALSSEIRLNILYYLYDHPGCSLNNLADVFNISRAGITQHAKILLNAGLVEIKSSVGQKRARKACYLKEDKFIISIKNQEIANKIYETEIPIGQYVDYAVTPTCGIATAEKVIGKVDNPCYFNDPERVNAGILWFHSGFIEYRLPNYLKKDTVPTEIQLTMELSSEAPGVAENWLSDISFKFNGINLGQCCTPGDFGEMKRGLYTPAWWKSNWNQYGILVLLSINSRGVFVDGMQISSVTIDSLNLTADSPFLFRMAVSEKAKHVGGFTLFGKNFGNYNQDIKLKVSFRNK